MAEFQNTIDLLGDEVVAASIISRTITEFNDDVLDKVGNAGFYLCDKLTSVNLPNATSIGQYAFNKCTALTSVNLPNATSIGQYAFNQCTALTSVNLPNVTIIYGTAFPKCIALTSVDLPKVTQIRSGAFNGCTNLKTLILRNPTVCDIFGTTTLSGTPFASGGTGGTVYCPASLISSYQSAADWSTYYAAGTCNFVAIEGSKYE